MRQATYVINLPHRTDRRAAMRKELARIGWHAEFFPAIRPTEPAGFPSIGARGCFLSHLAVLKQAAQDDVERLIMLEDDLSFSSDFSRRWPQAIEALQGHDWAVFYPGHILDDLPAGLSLLSSSTAVRCTHFMMIHRAAVPVLIDGLETILSRPPGHPSGGAMHVDGAYSTLRMQTPGLKTYACWPVLGYQRPSRTDVGKQKWFDRIEVLSPLVCAGRNAKTKLFGTR
jgi:hypothetical protein